MLPRRCGTAALNPVGRAVCVHPGRAAAAAAVALGRATWGWLVKWRGAGWCFFLFFAPTAKPLLPALRHVPFWRLFREYGVCVWGVCALFSLHPSRARARSLDAA